MVDSYTETKSLLRGLPLLKGPFRPLNLASFPQTPHAAFHDWLRDAIENDIQEAHAMILSTVDENGCPDARVLILKNLDHRGWHFAIKADSPKGRHINNNPAVALNFYWPRLGRQIRIRGETKQLSASECAADFLEKLIGSKIRASEFQQSRILAYVTVLGQGLQGGMRCKI
jgi:pyridoxamine 5'-phosphate oxidase